MEALNVQIVNPKANYLLTGDKDLLLLKTFDTTQIVTITEFQTIIT